MQKLLLKLLWFVVSGGLGTTLFLGSSPTFAQPATYTKCAVENATCPVPTPGTVLYCGNSVCAPAKVASAPVLCNNATFGDPIYGVVKACYFLADPLPFIIGAVPIIYFPQTATPLTPPAGAAQFVFTAAQAVGCTGPAVGRNWNQDNKFQVWMGSCQKKGYIFSWMQVAPIPATGQLQLVQPTGWPLEVAQ